MRTGRKWSRRTFVGAALVGAGVGAGALLRQTQKPGTRQKEAGAIPDGAFAYDISEFEKTDPKHLLYEASVTFETGFERVKRLTTAPGGMLLVAGDHSVKLLNTSGVLQSEIKLEQAPHCLHVPGPDELFVGFGNYFKVYDFSGKPKLRSPWLGQGTFLSAIGVRDQMVYLADAGGREVLICDRRSGAITGRFGKKDEPPGCPGFVVPSPYFDLAVGRDRLHIANPGRLRVETYTFDGQFESSWGEPGMVIDRFCGCCNPVYIARTPEGRFITSEKGLARVNIYCADGSFAGAVAGPEVLVDDKQLARRACTDCRLGAGFDVGCDEKGRIAVLDPFRKTVRMFVPLAQG